MNVAKWLLFSLLVLPFLELATLTGRGWGNRFGLAAHVGSGHVPRKRVRR